MVFKCDKCSSSFQYKQDLNRHLTAIHNGVTFSCDICEFNTNRRDNLQRHRKSKHAKRKLYECDTRSPKKAKPCDWDNGITHKELLEALESAETKDVIEPEPEKRSGGHRDGGRELQDAQQLEPAGNQHGRGVELHDAIELEKRSGDQKDVGVEAHDAIEAEGEWSDDITAEEFDAAAAAQSIEPDRFRCSICDASFSFKDNLTRHIKLKHSDIKPWACNHCDKTFSRKDYLMRHVKSHNAPPKKEKPSPKKTGGRVNLDFDGGAGVIDDNGMETAMRGMFTNKTWLIRKAKDPRLLLKKYHNTIKRWLQMLLLKNPLKFYLTMRITMVKINKDGVKQRATAGFNGATRILLRDSEISEIYRNTSEKIVESFTIWSKNGSGWIFESIDDLTLHTAEYQPYRGSSYIPTPASIVGKLAVINPVNQNDHECFRYATLLHKNYQWLDQGNAAYPITEEMIHNKNLQNLDYSKCKSPMEIDDIAHFEDCNKMAINVYHIKYNGSAITPLRISPKKVPLQDFCNLLLIEGTENSHFAYIKNFDRLLSFGTHQHQFCPFCLSAFDVRYRRKLEDHMPDCREYGGQKTILPKIGKSFCQYSDFHKELKAPIVIEADFETINTKLDGVEPDPNKSWTHKKTKHETSGYAYVVKSPYKEDKYVWYRGEDAGEKFIKAMMQEEEEQFKWLKDNEFDLNMSEENEEEFQKQEKCHICKDPFLDKTKPEELKHLKVLKPLLEINRLDVKRIPSLRKVKKQKRIISKELHPDKVGPERVEELTEFFNKNQELQDYLLEHDIIVHDHEDDDLYEAEDEMSDEEIERILKKGWKVRDHDHFSGEFRGAAHNGCNLAYRKVRKIPVIFHNLSNYDGHIIFENISKTECKDPKPIAKTMDKYIGFTIGKLEFKDSNQHLNSSLDKLVSNLADKTKIENCLYCPRRGIKEEVEKHMKIVHKKEHETLYTSTVKNPTLQEVFPTLYNFFQNEYPDLDEGAFYLLPRKGVYPYSYMDSHKRFDEEKLPPRECFFNDLTKKHISDEDYSFVQELWKTFNLKTLGELHDLYMMTDTLLLADVFEFYRTTIIQNYGLDPAHFYTAPSLSWSAGLKYTKVKLEIPRDVDVHIFIDKALRGGISMVANHFARANNPALEKFWDPSRQMSFIKFIDANNLYGWAMSQILPTGGFKWMSPKDLLKGQIKFGGGDDKLTMSEYEDVIQNLDVKGNTGYFFEVDLAYPQQIHDTHNEFPLAPESMKIEKEMLSAYQTKLGDELGVKYGQQEKLCLTLKDKKKYICHYRNLQFYLSQGLELKRIHRVLQFKQSDWLKPYIDLNTRLRQDADNEFEQNFAKLMNNSFFGKVYFLKLIFPLSNFYLLSDL